MSETTPGEWELLPNGNGEGLVLVAYEPYTPEVVATIHQVEDGDMEANGKLLAVSKELLALLVEAEHDLRQRARPDDDWMERCRAAIAKAT